MTAPVPDPWAGNRSEIAQRQAACDHRFRDVQGWGGVPRGIEQCDHCNAVRDARGGDDRG